MNRQSFQDLVKGQYGRKIAYVNYNEVTEDNVVKIASVGLTTLNWNRTAIRYLYDYYKGDQPALYRSKTVRDDINNPVVENHAFEFVSFKNGQTYGEPVQCVSLVNDEKINKGVDKLNSYNKNAGKMVADIESGEYTSAVGQGYKAIQRTYKKDIPYRIISLDPMNTIIVYSQMTKEPLLAVQSLKDAENQQYLHCFSETTEYIIKNSNLQVLEIADGIERRSRIHAFGGIPIVEYPNNAARLSDIELVISLLDAVNETQSNRVDDIAQLVQSYFKFVNCDIDRDSFEDMKQAGAIVVQSNAMNGSVADVGILSQELNQQGTQIAKDDLLESAMSVLAIPNRESQNSGGDTQGAVQLRAGYDVARQRANLKDPFVVASDKRLNRVALKIIAQAKGVDECPLTEMDYDVHILHSPTDNLLVKSEALEILLRSGIHPLVAIKVCGLWSDPERTFLQSKECLNIKQEYNIDKAIDEAGVRDQEDKARAILEGRKVG